GGIVVNEILPDPTGSPGVDTDGDGTATATDEFIELYNAGNETVDLGGLELWDPGARRWFTFPDDSPLPPDACALVAVRVAEGGALPVLGPEDLAFDAGRSTGVLNNGGDNVIVLEPESAHYLQLTYDDLAAVDPALDLGPYGFPAHAELAGDIQRWGDHAAGTSLARSPDGTGDPLLHLDLGEPASPGRSNDG
ncbi:MAG: lamin tail domain-containing protein, partial [Spirochaetaceae bacterium]